MVMSMLRDTPVSSRVCSNSNSCAEFTESVLDEPVCVSNVGARPPCSINISTARDQNVGQSVYGCTVAGKLLYRAPLPGSKLPGVRSLRSVFARRPDPNSRGFKFGRSRESLRYAQDERVSDPRFRSDAF